MSPFDAAFIAECLRDPDYNTLSCQQTFLALYDAGKTEEAVRTLVQQMDKLSGYKNGIEIKDILFAYLRRKRRN